MITIVTELLLDIPDQLLSANHCDIICQLYIGGNYGFRILFPQSVIFILLTARIIHSMYTLNNSCKNSRS